MKMFPIVQQLRPFLSPSLTDCREGSATLKSKVFGAKKAKEKQENVIQGFLKKEKGKEK
jgi:hypothetical protein